MTAYISVRSWDRYQHYKKRHPPWIKLYNTLLDDYDLMALDPRLRWMAVAILLLASRTDNKIPADLTMLRNRLWMDDLTQADVDKLVSVGFVRLSQDASTPLATPISQTETEGETEITVATQPGKPVDKNPLGWAVELLRETLWLGKAPPARHSTTDNDLSIVKAALKAGYDPLRIERICRGAALRRQAGDFPDVERGEPMSLKRLYHDPKWGGAKCFEMCEHAYYQAQEKKTKGRSTLTPISVQEEAVNG